MELDERLKRARIQIQKRNNFFAYLSLYLKFKKADNLPEWAGAGVNAKGDFFYNEKWLGKLSDEEIQGVVCHEVLHLALLHLTRIGNRHQEIWNIATDLTINTILKKNHFTLPNAVLVPDSQDTYNFFGLKIPKISKKTSEEIYDKLMGNVKVHTISMKDFLKGRFDAHMKGSGKGSGKNGKEEQEFSKSELEKAGKFWSRKLNEAVMVSKMRGDLPLGMDRLVGELHREKISWKALLSRYMMDLVPYNYSYSKAHKRSRSIGAYMPDLLKEKVDVVIGIDVSGSIGQKELTDFLSEIIGMANAFQERIDMRILTHECDVNNDYMVTNGNVDKIKKLKIEGGGGTAHKPIFKYILEKVPACKCAIFLTDGYSDIQDIKMDKYPFEKIFVISEEGDKECIGKNNALVIDLKNV